MLEFLHAGHIEHLLTHDALPVVRADIVGQLHTPFGLVDTAINKMFKSIKCGVSVVEIISRLPSVAYVLGEKNAALCVVW